MTEPRADRSADDDYPNPAGGLSMLLYPVRRYVLVFALIAIPVLIIISVVR